MRRSGCTRVRRGLEREQRIGPVAVGPSGYDSIRPVWINPSLHSRTSLRSGFAFRAAEDTRALRHEERLARLPELAAEYGDRAIHIQRSGTGTNALAELSRLHLSEEIVASGESLPATQALAEHEVRPGHRLRRRGRALVGAALGELDERLAPPRR